LLLVSILVATGFGPLSCQSESNRTSVESEEQRKTTQDLPTHQQLAKALGSKTGAVSQHDIDAVGRLSGLSREWNTTVAPLIRDYMDPTVSAEAWVQASRQQLAGLRSVYTRYYAIVMSMEDEGIRSSAQELANNYKDKLAALVSLQHAVSVGDADAELAAQVGIQTAAQEGQELGMALIARMRQIIPADSVEAWLTESADAVNKAMQP
jgi:hypothetical protein